jgi:hypothetical protein
MNAKINNGEFWGAHAYSVLVSAFCGDELRLNVAACRVVNFEKSSRRQNASASTLQACAPQKTGAASSHPMK